MAEVPLPDVLTFTPILMPKVWGGRRLEAFGKCLPQDAAIGESWEVADLPGDGPVSEVDSGPMKGCTLRQLLEDPSTCRAIMGSVPLNAEGRFPLLIKFLDACDNLSVQVHPDQAWVASHRGDFLKSEAWLVLEADAGSLIHAGLKRGTTASTLAQAVAEGTVVDVLRSVPARSGDCHSLVSGTCHALGAGVLVAEVQTTSDTTFRLYDWGRTDRVMHVEQALACIDLEASPPCVDAGEVPESGVDERVVARTKWFTMTKVVSAGGVWTRVGQDRPTVVMCAKGSACIGDVALSKGRTALITAAAGDVAIEVAKGAVLATAFSQPPVGGQEVTKQPFCNLLLRKEINHPTGRFSRLWPTRPASRWACR